MSNAKATAATTKAEGKKKGKEKEEGTPIVRHPYREPKAEKLAAAHFEITRGKQVARTMRRMARDANETYEEWRRSGFKGAWWRHYFVGQDSD